MNTNPLPIMNTNLFPKKGPSFNGQNISLAVCVAMVAWVVPVTAQPAADGNPISYKPRIIVTTDLGADPDDEQSLVRLLVSANEFDIEGLIVSTGCWKKNQSNTAMLDKIVDAYGKSLPNLQIHAKGFPSYEYHNRSLLTLGFTVLPFGLAAMPLFAGDVSAFPGAEGYGSVTHGGRGGKVMPVNNLHPSGPGSLQAACGAERPRLAAPFSRATTSSNEP